MLTKQELFEIMRAIRSYIQTEIANGPDTFWQEQIRRELAETYDPIVAKLRQLMKEPIG